MTDQPYTPSKHLVGYAYVRTNAIKAPEHELWDEYHGFIAAIEAAAEQRGMRLAQEAIAGDQTVERARHRVGGILSTAQVLHVIDQAIKNRADQEGAQGE